MAWDLTQYNSNVTAGLIPAGSHLFADDAAFQTVDTEGNIIPNVVGAAYSAPDAPNGIPYEATDPRAIPLNVYIDVDTPTPTLSANIRTDGRGYLVPFCAPVGLNRLWVDFGNGRVMLTASDLGDQIASIDPLSKSNTWLYQMQKDDFGMVIKGIPSSLAQIFQVRDPFDSPIFSVGHVGGPAAYGDNMSVYDGSFNLMAQMGLNGTLTLAGGKVLSPGDIDTLHGVGPQPSDQSFLAWACDPAVANVSNTPTAGTVYLTRIVLRRPGTINSIGVGIVTNGVGVANGFLGLYNSSGTRVGVTAATTFAPSFAGYSPVNLVTPYVASPGVYWVAILVGSATTMPVFMGMGSTVAQVNLANANTVAAANRYAINGTAKTSLATSLTLSANNVPQVLPTAMMPWASIQ